MQRHIANGTWAVRKTFGSWYNDEDVPVMILLYNSSYLYRHVVVRHQRSEDHPNNNPP